MLVCQYRCVWNYVGSVKLMEGKSGVKRSNELLYEGILVEVVEGDEDIMLCIMLFYIKQI